MNTQHTPKPLAVSFIHHEALGLKMYFDCICVMSLGRPSDSFIETARRIVACVNACAGISTDTLIEYGDGNLEALFKMQQQRDELQAKYDELLAALERISKMDSMSYHCLETAKIAARKAIAKAMGQQS